MYYIVLGEFAGLFYSPVNWESFNLKEAVYEKKSGNDQP